ncbi:hypothetical protein Moror_5644 [Moniliophthora roreri MCA 2997]|uniref:Uncharacterized protein n=2 Tax=Moniliophthora roreri TaxID=221103 RepID=V2WRC8_MONRO|nr:hypothetical protein Moror_5644 [Moniliophthora roreri MCA 2997]
MQANQDSFEEGMIDEDNATACSLSPPACSPSPESLFEVKSIVLLSDITEARLTMHGFGLGDTPHNRVKFCNGIVGALLPDTRQFITSPNSGTIPSPPLGSTRDLY